MFNFLERNVYDRVSNPVALGYTDVDSDRIDMQTYSADAVTFGCELGSVETGAVLELQVWEHTSDAAAGTEITDGNVTFTAGATDADDKVFLVTVARSKITKRYVYCTLVRATAQAEVDSMFAIIHCPRTLPMTQSADVLDSATLAT